MGSRAYADLLSRVASEAAGLVAAHGGGSVPPGQK